MNLTPAILKHFNHRDATTLTPHERIILAHYQREVDLSRIDYITATKRCIGDINGRNYHPAKEQRGETITSTTSEEI